MKDSHHDGYHKEPGYFRRETLLISRGKAVGNLHERRLCASINQQTFLPSSQNKSRFSPRVEGPETKDDEKDVVAEGYDPGKGIAFVIIGKTAEEMSSAYGRPGKRDLWLPKQHA